MNQLVKPLVENRLVERVQSLGLTLLRIKKDQPIEAVSACSWFEKAILRSRLLQQAVDQHAEALFAPDAGRVTLLDGVSLVVLQALKRSEVAGESPELQAVLIIGPNLIHSGDMNRICDQLQLDVQATLSRVDRSRLMGVEESERLVKMLAWMQSDAEGLATHRDELSHLSEELANNYEELSLLYKLSCGMTLDQPPAEFFGDACSELQEVSGLGWIALKISEDQPRLGEINGRLYTAGEVSSTVSIQRLGRDLIRRFANRHEPIILDDCSALGDVDAKIGKSMLVVPLVREGQTLGVLYGADRLDGQHIDSVDAKLCASLCNSLAIFLENLMLFEDAQSLFIGTLHALTSAIDAKDSYTFGHSERVALLSEMLARAAGVDEATVERIYLAGLVHDVGKIGVPEQVLCKPGRLTDAEFEQIKMHPAIGANILRDIRQMEDLIPGVLYHHERWDGRGYPERRAGLDIPLFGRVIGLADAFDAMSSDRTYRSAMDLQVVLEEITLHAGRQFDPELAELFVSLDFEPYFKMITRHRDVRVGAERATTSRVNTS